MWPQKGAIELGFDADIVLWDPKKKVTISQKNLHHGADYTPWEGFEVTGVPVTTISNGIVVYSEGQFLTEPKGKFVHRGISSLIES